MIGYRSVIVGLLFLLLPLLANCSGSEKAGFEEESNSASSTSISEDQSDLEASGQSAAEPLDLFPVLVSGRWGYIDRTGEIRVEPQFDEARHFWGRQLAGVRVGDKWGFVDSRGTLLVKPQYYEVGNVDDGAVWVVLDEARRPRGFLDETGQELIAPKLEYVFTESGEIVRGFSEGLAAASKGGVWGFIDKSGSFAISPQFSRVRHFSEGLAAVEVGEVWGFIDSKGARVIEPQFDYVMDFSEGFAVARKEERRGFIDSTGKFVLEPPVDALDAFSEGMAAVKHGDKWGFLDRSGLLVIEPTYESAGRFSEGLAAVEAGGKYGFVNKTGTLVIPTMFSGCYVFSSGLAAVYLDDWGDERLGYIDPRGDYVWEPKS